jgi:hypothetical protein
MQEIFKPIQIFSLEDLYEVSNFGNVRSLIPNRYKTKNTVKKKKPILLKPNDRGQVSLTARNGDKYKEKVNRLVAKAFIQSDDTFYRVENKDKNIMNNHVDNIVLIPSKRDMTKTQRLEERLERNNSIYNDFMSGMSIPDLSAKYDITKSNISYKLSDLMASKKGQNKELPKDNSFMIEVFNSNIKKNINEITLKDLSDCEKQYIKECAKNEVTFESHRSIPLHSKLKARNRFSGLIFYSDEIIGE